MTLSDYLKRKKLSIQRFSDKVGIAVYSIHRYLGGRVPSTKAILAIHKATGGAVQPNDFYPLSKGRKK